MTTDDLMPSSEACAALGGIHPGTLSRWVAAGRITPALRAPGLRGAMFFHRSDVEALAAQLDGAVAS